jgi:tetratricopeptide (TPR) repeat protein
LVPLNIPDLIVRFALSLASNPALTGGSPGEEAKTGLSVLFFLILVPLIIGFLFLVFFLYKQTIGKRRQTTLKEDYQREADEYERSGRFVSAAALYESNLKNKRKAAELYERGGDFKQAAFLYDLMGIADKAKEMYEKDGNIEDAAEVSVLEGNYEEAAKLYDKAGKKIDAAVLLEKAGRRLAAVRVYREAGEYRQAARLLEEEGMLREAAEMYGISLQDKKPEASTMDDFYTYGIKLERAGETGKAHEVFIMLDRINHAYRNVKEKVQTLAPPPQPEEDLGSRTTLRSFIKSGKIEPRYALKLWVHILKSLQEAYTRGRAYGCLSPDSIAIDSQNATFFLSRPISSAYTAPEIAKGVQPDAGSDIYSAGIILYEMLIGNLEGLGSARLMNLVEDVPDWLDEIVIRCIRKVREDRYQSIEDIFNDIKALSREKKGPSQTV